MSNERLETIMTDNEIEEVIDTLKENLSEDTKNLREINNTEFPVNTLERGDLYEGNALAIVNNETGEQTLDLPKQIERADVSLTDITEGVEIGLSEEMLKEAAPDMFSDMGLSEEESMQMINLILKVKKGEKVSIYKEMPEPVKRTVRGIANTNNMKILQTVAKDVMGLFVSNINIDKEFADFQQSLKKELDIQGVADLYDEHLKNVMTVDLIKKAEELEAIGTEESIKKGKDLRDISSGYIDAIEFTRIRQAVENNELAARKLDKEIKRIDKHCRDFNYKYNDSKFVIKDVSLMLTTLGRVLPDGIPAEDIMKFVVVFCRTAMNMSPDNILEHVYMYYTVQTVLSLEFIQMDSPFFIEATNAILEIINLIGGDK